MTTSSNWLTKKRATEQANLAQARLTLAEDEREIPGYPNYRANTAGEIISIVYGKRRVMRTQFVGGALQVTLRNSDGMRTSCTVGALVAAAFHGNRHGTIRFLDGNPHNTRPDNIAWLENCAVSEPPPGLTPVPGYPGLFVTPNGAVFTTKGKANDGLMRPLLVHYSVKNYPRVSFYKDGKAQSKPVHQLVALTFLPPPTAHQTLVRHLDGDKNNPSYTNLKWGTAAENAADEIHHTRFHTIRSLRHLGADGLARRFGVSKTTVEQVLDDEQFNHNIIRENFTWT